jgi:hypothetical protein
MPNWCEKHQQFHQRIDLSPKWWSGYVTICRKCLEEQPTEDKESK